MREPDGASVDAPDAQFTRELVWLYEAAGSPTHEVLIRAARGNPAVKLVKQTVSDWLTGKSVPSDSKSVLYLISILTALARRRPGFVARPVDWRGLHASAKAARRNSRRQSLDRGVGSRTERRRGGGEQVGGGARFEDAETRPLGLLINECDPIALEVHRAIDVPGSEHHSVLPPYVQRAHDRRLRRIADEVLAGASRMVTLVGESSTGKTRACWELVKYIESATEFQHGGDTGSPRQWRIWHPFDPTRPGAAAEDVGQVAPFTIVWLNEAQLYLAPSDQRLGERVAAGLRTLLTRKNAGPVLVMATMWPSHWIAITSRPEAGLNDPQAQARELLGGTDIDVPDAFTIEDQADLASRDDPQLNYARTHASGGRITQYLAGAPLLLDRSLKASPIARAVLNAAIDARRIGHPPAIPIELLERAALGYLDDGRQALDGDDSLEPAITYLTAPCNGAHGPLTRLRARPNEQHTAGYSVPVYRLADYLEQTCTPPRLGAYPPQSFWRAAASTINDVSTLHAFAQAAERRGRYRDAALLYSAAARRGDIDALVAIARLREQADDEAGAAQLYSQAARHGNGEALNALAFSCEREDNPLAANDLYRYASECGNSQAARALARLNGEPIDSQVTGAEADAAKALRYTNSLSPLERTPSSDPRRQQSADAEDAFKRGDTGRLRQRSVDSAAVALAALTRQRERSDDLDGAELAANEAADLGYTGVLSRLALRRDEVGDVPRAIRLGRAAADRGNPIILCGLGRRRERAGYAEQAAALYREAANRGDLNALVHLARLLESSGHTEGALSIRRFGLDAAGEPHPPWSSDDLLLPPTLKNRRRQASGRKTS